MSPDRATGVVTRFATAVEARTCVEVPPHVYVGGAPVGATEHSETVKWRPLVASVFKRELVLAVKPRVMLASFAVAPVEFRSVSYTHLDVYKRQEQVVLPAGGEGFEPW